MNTYLYQLTLKSGQVIGLEAQSKKALPELLAEIPEAPDGWLSFEVGPTKESKLIVRTAEISTCAIYTKEDADRVRGQQALQIAQPQGRG